MSFINELKRRSVIRVAVGYLGVTWLLIQILETLFPIFDLPETSIRVVVVALAIGFIPALIFAWVFELSPGGLIRDSGTNVVASPASNKRFDRIITLVLVLAVAIFSVDTFILDPERDAEEIEAATKAALDTMLAGNPGGTSIAVLPFVDLSPAQDQEYFADGLSEDLLNGLARLRGLQVTGRTSSFSFKGSNENLQTIGKILRVGHILEGSVRTFKDQLRVTAQLVDTFSGLQVWSGRYDRQLADIFAVQDEIAEAVATALSITLGVGDLGGIPGSTKNVDAYNEVLLGQSLYRKFTRDSVLSAIDHFKQAIRLDPHYALAWERLADIYTTTRVLVGVETSRNWEQLSSEALDRALDLAPDSPDILSTVAFRQAHLGQWQDAQRALDHASALDAATQVDAIDGYITLFFLVGRARETIDPLEHRRRLDPLSGLVAWYAGHAYTEAGRFDEGLAELERSFSLGNYLSEIVSFGIVAALASGDSSVLQAWLDRSIEHNPQTRPMIQAMSALSGDSEAAVKWLHQDFQANLPGDKHLSAIWAAYHGDPELALNIMAAQSQGTWTFWSPLTAQVRKLPGFKELVRGQGLVGYWREFGWSEYCRPLGAEDFHCQ